MKRRESIRPLALVVHRYVGLTMAIFLLVAGLTGCLLAFNAELDRMFAPELLLAPPPSSAAAPLDPFVLSERVQAQLAPGQHHYSIDFDPKPGEATSFWLQVEHDSWRQFFADPYTGRLLGSRKWGDLSEGTKNLMPFIYRLHYSLGLGEVGSLLFGIVALLWTLDCFVGAYLTFPNANASRASGQRSWLQRWLPAWLVRANQLFSFVFSWHRASGLWVWAMLLVFAWSAVGLNLRPLYLPVMKGLAGMQESVHDGLPELSPPFPSPSITMKEAHDVGRRLMAAEARARGFHVKREVALGFHEDHGVFTYNVESDLDIASEHAHTMVYFAGDGSLIGFEAATGVTAGNTLESWLFGLHFAAVGGLWYRIFVSLMGLAVAALSITGVWIWWRKRGKRVSTVRRASPRPSQVLAQSDLANAQRHSPSMSPKRF